MKLEKNKEVLSDRAVEIDIFEKWDDIQLIKRYMEQAYKDDENLITLSAKQFGFNYRMFSIKFNDEIKYFVNPMISKREGLHISIESNIGIEDAEYIITRSDRILAIYQTIFGLAETNKFEGVAAELFQQQVDLLDSVLLSDVGLEIDDDFKNASDEEKQQVVDLYINSLQERDKQLQDEIQNNEHLKKTADAIKFMTGVATGEIEIERKIDESKLNREQRRALKKQLSRVGKKK